MVMLDGMYTSHLAHTVNRWAQRYLALFDYLPWLPGMRIEDAVNCSIPY